MAGSKMLRVDIPLGSDDAGQDITLTEYYSGAALYALRPCTEAVARDQTKWMSDPRPTAPLDFKPRPRLMDDVRDSGPDEFDEEKNSERPF